MDAAWYGGIIIHAETNYFRVQVHIPHQTSFLIFNILQKHKDTQRSHDTYTATLDCVFVHALFQSRSHVAMRDLSRPTVTV